MAITILEADLHREALEGLEVAIALQQVSDSRTADFEDIRLAQQGGRLNGITHGAAEPGAIVKGDIFTTRTPDLNLHRHRAKVSQHLEIHELESLVTSGTRCDRGEIWQKGVRQRGGGSVGLRPDG